MPELLAPEQYADKLQGRGVVQTQPKGYWLRSGHHVSDKVEGDVVTEDPELCHEAGLQLTKLIRPYKIDLLIPVPTGGDALAKVIEGELEGVPVAYTCKVTGKIKFKVREPSVNAPRIEAGTRVGIVDDVYSTGGSIKDMADMLYENFGYRGISQFKDQEISEGTQLIVAAFSLWDRMLPVEKEELPFPHESVIHRQVL